MNVLIITLMVLLLASCNDSEATATPDKTEVKQETALEHALKHADTTYVCPMHSQIVRGKPGKCPICGMDLVEVKQDEAPKTTTVKQKKILYWVAPMDPNYRRDGPGKSPMGMDLVPVYDEGDTAVKGVDGPVVKIAPEVENNMGVRTAKAETGTLWRKIRTVGYASVDDAKVSHVHLRTEGWIEQLAIESEGDRVKKGQRLFNLYSPTLVNAMDEYVQALSTSNQRLIQASADKLVSLGIGQSQINALKKNRRVPRTISVYAAQNGVVTELKVREGMYVKPMNNVLTLADLSSIWIQAEVFESQSDWVKVGQSADVKLSFVPGRTWEGKVNYVYPTLDPKTRTLKVRMQFDNPDEAIKPNMYASVTIYAGPLNNVLSIPREALIRTGDKQRVIVAIGKSRFAQKQVVAGMESGDFVEIKQGLKPGDTVVTSGQFLIDSEASLRASILRMTRLETK